MNSTTEPERWSERRLAGLGFALGAGVALLFVLLAIPIGFASNAKVWELYERQPDKFSQKVARSAVVSIPVAGAIGSALVLALMRGRRSGALLLALSVFYSILILHYGSGRNDNFLYGVALIWLLQILCITALLWVRFQLFLGAAGPVSHALAVIFAAALALGAFAFFVTSSGNHFHDRIPLAVALSLVPTDLLLCGQVGRLTCAGRMPFPANRFRVSLSTLMTITLCAAAYVTLVVTLFRR